jgi:hypothetical protein
MTDLLAYDADTDAPRNTARQRGQAISRRLPASRAPLVQAR